jgi:hypothetical protein
MGSKGYTETNTRFKRNYYAERGLKDATFPLLLSHYRKLCALRELLDMPFRVILNNMLRDILDPIESEEDLKALAEKVKADADKYANCLGTHKGDATKLKPRPKKK